jgi:hypothetical protein
MPWPALSMFAESCITSVSISGSCIPSVVTNSQRNSPNLRPSSLSTRTSIPKSCNTSWVEWTCRARAPPRRLLDRGREGWAAKCDVRTTSCASPFQAGGIVLFLRTLRLWSRVTGNPLAIPNSRSWPVFAVRADLTRIGQYDGQGPGSADPSGEDRSLAATGRQD